MNHKKIHISLTLDTIAALVVWLVFYAYRYVVNDMALGREEWTWSVPSYSLLLSFFSFPVVATAVYALLGAYNNSKPISRLNELTGTLVSTFIVAIIIYFSMVVDDKVVDYSAYIISFVVLWLLLFVVTYLFRYIYVLVLFSRESKGCYPVNAVVVGVGRQSERALSYFKNKKSAQNRHFIGFVDPRKSAGRTSPDRRVVGSVDDIDRIVAEHKVSVVIVALDKADDDATFDIINRLLPLDVQVKILPERSNIILSRVRIDSISSEPFITLGITNMPAWQESVKRFFDIVASALAGLLLSPLLLYISLHIKCSTRGPVIYRQERVGKGGQPFTIYKFRSMYIDSECSGPALSSANDKRITPYGRVLRKYRLDELPQLWNIIKGDMSIVGPRPERRYYIDKIQQVAPYYPLVYRTRPGLLSWGPIRVGYADTIEKMVERLDYDIVYIDNMSLALDVKIMLYSLKVIFNGEGQ